MTENKVPIDLVDNENIPPKLLLIDANVETVYYLATIYLEEISKRWQWRGINKRPHIAFAFNYKNAPDSELIKYLKRNCINFFYYSTDNPQTFKALAGYKHVILFDVFNNFAVTNIEEPLIYNFQHFISLLKDNNCLIHVLLPDYIFEPSEEIYASHEKANSSMPYKRIATSVFISHMIEYYRLALKFPVYRITYPQIYQHENKDIIKINEKNINSLLVTYMKTVIIQNNTEIPARPVITFKEFAECLYLLYKSQLKPKNYSISSEAYFQETELNNTLHNKLTKSWSQKVIKTDYEELYGLGFKPLKKEEHIDIIKKISFDNPFLRERKIS